METAQSELPEFILKETSVARLLIKGGRKFFYGEGFYTF